MRHGPDASLEWTENKWGGAVKRSPLPRIPSNALAPVVPQRDALPQSPSPLPRMPPGWPWRRGKIRGAKSLEWSKSYAIIINVSSEYLSWSETEEPRLIRSLNLFAPPSCRTKGSTSKVPSDLLPAMHADAVLRDGARTIVLECKFYQETLQIGPWGGRPKLHSAHLYQLTSYLKNLHASVTEQQIEGLLVYPTVGTHLAENFILSGTRVRVCTMDLGADWSEIATQMKGFLISQQPGQDAAK